MGIRSQKPKISGAGPGASFYQSLQVTRKHVQVLSKPPSDSEARASSNKPCSREAALLSNLSPENPWPVPSRNYQNTENKGNFVQKPSEAPVDTEEQSKDHRLWRSQTLRIRTLMLPLRAFQVASHSFCDCPFLER